MDAKTIVCLLMIFIAVISVCLPNRVIDTVSCKRNWVVVLLVLSGSLIIVDKFEEGMILLLILVIGFAVTMVKKTNEQVNNCSNGGTHDR